MAQSPRLRQITRCRDGFPIVAKVRLGPNTRIRTGALARPKLAASSFRLGLRAARPIELIIEAYGQGVEIGLHAYGRDRVEIVVLCAEIIEVVFDLTCKILDQTEFDADAYSKASAIISQDLRGDGRPGGYISKTPSGAVNRTEARSSGPAALLDSARCAQKADLQQSRPICWQV